MARGSDSLWARHRQPVSWSEEGDGHPPHHVARQRWSARVTSRSPRGVGVLGERGLGRFGVLDAHASGCVCGTCTGAPTAGDGEQTSGAWPLLADPPGWDKIQQGKGQVTRETVAGGGGGGCSESCTDTRRLFRCDVPNAPKVEKRSCLCLVLGFPTTSG